MAPDLIVPGESPAIVSVMIEVELLGVKVEVPSNTPVVAMRELGGRRRSLSIFIGAPEATAIAFALEGVETPRPLTHDLLKDVIDKLDVSVERVVVTELRDTTFFAELHLVALGETHVVSSRPSDAVALAARVDCPIFVEDDVLDAAGVVDENDHAAAPDAEVVVEEFRQFIENINPDDFAS